MDAGGTFTDAVLWDEETGEIRSAKASSNRQDPGAAVLQAIDKLGLDPRQRPDVGFLVHGTTVVTNATLEGAGARIALICTQGFRDVLEIGRLTRTAEQLYDLRMATPPSLVKRRDRIEVVERVDHRGQVVCEVDANSVREAAHTIQARGITSIAVCLLHSHVNPAHERQVAGILREELDGVSLSLSSEVLPEFREYERTSTTTLNAYVVPVASGYLERLEGRIREWSPRTRLCVMQSNGGVTSASRAARNPVSLLLSGPSAGVIAGRQLARETGLRHTITMDMGGTSLDACLLPDNELLLSHERRVLDIPVRVPSVDILTIGAGGGSIGWVDGGGQFRVGPRSAGADPGPACYGRGGTEPTATDANLVLGYLEDGQSLGGEMRLDAGAAAAACERLGRRLGLDGLTTAWGIRTIVNTAMAGAVRAVSIGRGHDPRDFTLIAFGGAGPMHAFEIARELDIPEVLVPPIPGCHSAYGMVVTDVAHDYVSSIGAVVGDGLEQRLDGAFGDVEALAHRELDEEGITPDRRDLFRSLDVRYAGQQAAVTAPASSRDPGWLGFALEEFHRLHERMFGFRVPEEPVEVVNVRVRSLGRIQPEQAPPSYPRPHASGAAVEPRGSRLASFGARPEDLLRTPVFERSALGAGAALVGPAVVEQDDSTLVIPPGASAAADAAGNLWLRATA